MEELGTATEAVEEQGTTTQVVGVEDAEAMLREAVVALEVVLAVEEVEVAAEEAVEVEGAEAVVSLIDRLEDRYGSQIPFY